MSYLAWFWLLTRYPASASPRVHVLDAPLRAAAGWLLLGEPVTPALVLAMACVAVGIYLVNREPDAGAARPRETGVRGT